MLHRRLPFWQVIVYTFLDIPDIRRPAGVLYVIGKEPLFWPKLAFALKLKATATQFVDRTSSWTLMTEEFNSF